MATKKDNELTKYLVPRMFYFFIEPESCSAEVCCDPDTGMGCTVDPDKQKAHVEVAIYRTNEEQTATDGDPRILRTWNKHENKAFKIVSSRKDGKLLLNKKEEIEFKRKHEKAYPVEGIKYDELPVMVLFNEWLEPDREFVAYARIHNGAGWGPWNRVAQTRLDFIDEEGNTIRDLPIVNPSPEIKATVDKRPIYPSKIDKGVKLKQLVIEDWVPIASVLVNGTDVIKKLHCEKNKEGKYVYKINSPLHCSFVGIKGNCQYITIIVDNVLGNKSYATQYYWPKYGKKVNKKTNTYDVILYQIEGACNIVNENKYEKPYRIYVRYHGMPFYGQYNKIYTEAKGQKRKYINVPVKVCNGKNPVDIRVFAEKYRSEKKMTKRSVYAYYGPVSVEDPKEISPIIEPESNAKDNDKSFTDVSMAHEVWTWTSEPLIVGGMNDKYKMIEGDNIIDARSGELIQAYIPIGDNKRMGSRIMQSGKHIGTMTKDDDFSCIVSSKGAVAGIGFVAERTSGNMSAKYNDLLRFEVYTIYAEKEVRVNGNVNIKNAGSPSSKNIENNNLLIQSQNSQSAISSMLLYYIGKNEHPWHGHESEYKIIFSSLETRKYDNGYLGRLYISINSYYLWVPDWLEDKLGHYTLRKTALLVNGLKYIQSYCGNRPLARIVRKNSSVVLTGHGIQSGLQPRDLTIIKKSVKQSGLKEVSKEGSLGIPPASDEDVWRKVESAIRYSKASAQSSPGPKGKSGKSYFEKFISEKYLKPYYDLKYGKIKPVNINDTIVTRGREAAVKMMSKGDDREGNSAAFNAAHGGDAKYILRVGLQEAFSDYLKRSSDETYIDLDYMVGEHGWQPLSGRRDIKDIDNDAFIQGPNMTDLWHYSFGIYIAVSMSMLPQTVIQIGFILYEIDSGEGWNTLGFDSINDVISEEASRLFAADLLNGTLRGVPDDRGNHYVDLSSYFISGRRLVKKWISEKMVENILKAKVPPTVSKSYPGVSVWPRTYYTVAKWSMGNYDYWEDLVENKYYKPYEVMYAEELYKLLYY